MDNSIPIDNPKWSEFEDDCKKIAKSYGVDENQKVISFTFILKPISDKIPKGVWSKALQS